MTSNANAASLKDVQAQADALDLSRHPVWRKLIYFEGNQSAVISDDYFLSDRGKVDLHAELMATIEAFFDSNISADKKSAWCRFPARYYWLSKHIDLPFRDLKEETCISKVHWKSFDSIKSISLLLVSGYWGNPASTFGHAFLRMNVNSVDDPHDLFDLTLNYGAITPDHENPVRYIVKGLLGGYDGIFSDQYFYNQDLTYVRTEFRNIWDFQLNLTEEEKTLLVYHVWEITGKKFKYFFITRNCVYRIAALVNLVVEEDLLKRARPWYIPEELFVRMINIDKQRRKLTGTHLINSVQYIPSSKRKLFLELKRLNPAEKQVFNQIVRSGFVETTQKLETLDLESRIRVLNSLLVYQKYRLIAQGKKSDVEMEKIKDQILLARLLLPIRKDADIKVPRLAPPTEGSPPAVVRTGVGFERGEDPFLKISLSPFKKEMIGQNNLEGNEFALLDMDIGFHEENQEVFIDRFDLIHILNLETMAVDVIHDNKMSWKLRIGVDRIIEDDQDKHDGTANFGLGRAVQLNRYLLGFAMVDFQGHSLDPHARIAPHAGMRIDGGPIKLFAYAGIETMDYQARSRGFWGGKAQYSINQSSSLNFEANNRTATQMSLGLSLYW